MAKQEVERSFGALYSPKDVRDYKLVASASPVELPEEFHLDMVRIKNQGSVGSCVAHSLSEVVEFFNKKQHKQTYVMSTDFIYGNRRTSSYKGEGMVVRDALKALQKYGDIRATKFSGNTEPPEVIDKFEKNYEPLKEEAYKSRISTYVKLSSIDEIKTFLVNHGPVVMAMSWYSDFKVNSTGILTSSYDPSKIWGGHCMVIIGWTKDGWIIQNSWGESWGTKGTCLYPFEKTNTIRETWGVTDEILDDPDATDIDKPLDSGLGRVLARLLNWLLNLFSNKNTTDTEK